MTSQVLNKYMIVTKTGQCFIIMVLKLVMININFALTDYQNMINNLLFSKLHSTHILRQ